MLVNTVSEAKAQLSALLERVLAGEEVIIARAGRPIARLVPYEPTRAPREPGALRGRVRIAEDSEVLPAQVADLPGRPS